MIVTEWAMGAQAASAAPWLVAIGASALAAGLDVSRRRIPNRLTGPLLLSGALWSLWTGGAAGLLESLAAAAVLMAPTLALFALAGGGAGDAKLMAGLGAWLGLASGLAALLAVSISAVVMGLLLAMAGRRFRESLGRIVVWAVGQRTALAVAPSRGRSPAERTMPYGLAICTGVCVAAAARWCGGG